MEKYKYVLYSPNKEDLKRSSKEFAHYEIRVFKFSDYAEQTEINAIRSFLNNALFNINLQTDDKSGYSLKKTYGARIEDIHLDKIEDVLPVLKKFNGYFNIYPLKKILKILKKAKIKRHIVYSEPDDLFFIPRKFKGREQIYINALKQGLKIK